MGGSMMGTTDWTPVLIVLGLGLVVGVILALRMAKGAKAPPASATSGKAKAKVPARAAIDPDLVGRIRDLAAKRDALVARLGELEAAAPGEVGTARLAHERWDLELRAAEVLRELAGLEAKAGAPAAAMAAPAEPAAASGGPSWKTIAFALGGAAFFLAAVIAVRETATEKPGGGMGMGMGGPAMNAEEAHGGEAPPNPRIDALKAEVAAHPENVDARLELAEAYLVDARLFEAFETAKVVLEKDPENPKALTYVAVVRLAMGGATEAMAMLDKALAKDPSLAEAWSYKGLVQFELKQFGDAVKSWEKALELRPEGGEALEGLLAEARLRAAGKEPEAPAMPAAATAPAGGMPPAMGGSMPPAMGGGMPPASGAPAGPRLTGKVELAPALAGAVKGGTLFVIARPAGMQAGPPAAVRRLDVTAFPVEFTLDGGNSMTGAPLPEKLHLEVRLDGDGNAMTKDPADPIVRKDGVALGETVKLVLDRQ